MKATITRIATVLMAVGSVAIGGGVPAAAQDLSLNSELVPPGAGMFGVFDPSLAADASGNVHISYSVIDPSVMQPGQNERIVQIYIARSANQGITWDVLGGPVSEAEEVILPDSTPGTWQNEVSALVYDPSAPAAERWKMVWHHYLRHNGRREFQNGWIGYKTAPTPALLASAHEVKLFAGDGYNPQNDTKNGETMSPLGHPPKIRLDLEFPPLRDCFGFTEPGLTVTRDAVFLAMVCAQQEASNKIFLLRCAHPCDATRRESWTYAGTAAFPYLLTEAEAAAFGDFDGFSAPELYSFAGTDFLIASPTSAALGSNAYKGCLVFKFYDIDIGKLWRHPNGVPVVDAFISGTPGSFSGVCTVHARAYSGRYLYGEVRFPSPGDAYYSIFRSEQTFY